jgi:hypothetical protein
MDKQQAISYINQMLDQNHTREEIIRGLVEQLHAPEPIVAKFVIQTEAEYLRKKPEPLPAQLPSQPPKLPPWLEQSPTDTQSSLPITQPALSQPDWMQQLAGASRQIDSAPIEEHHPELVQTASSPSASSQTAPPPTSTSWESEARSFVIKQLEYGRLHSDIADELADRVSIPLEQAEKFVTGVSIQMKSPPQQKITNTTEAADFVSAEYAKGRPRLEIAAELATRTGEPQNLTEKFVALTISKIEKSKTQTPVKPPIDLNHPVLVKYVVNELAKNRKRSDIVMKISERTGADWDEAQRFVGQVSAEQHSQINARKNRLIIPMCIVAIVLGFVFTIGTVYPLIYWFTGRTEEFISMTRSIGSFGDYINSAPYIFFTGIVMIAGGAIGLIVALRSQMD